MKVKKSELFEALSKVKPALSDKAIIEQTDHFIFDNDYVRTYNDRIAISYPFKSGFHLAIKADEFFKLISKIESQEIELSESEGSLSITIEKTKGSIKGLIVTAAEVKCPAIIIKTKRWFMLPKNFSDAIRFCSFSADRNMLMKELTCLCINNNYVLSSDNFRATKYEMDSKLPEFLLPATVAQELAKHSPTHYVIEAEGAWIHFKNADGVIFSSRVIEGEYPQEDVWGLFTQKGDSIVIPEGLKESLDRAKIFSQQITEVDDLIQIRVYKSGKLTCRGEGALGWIEEEFKVDYKKKDFEVKVSPEALIEILSHVKEMKVSDDKLYFGGEKFEHVISLI